MLEKEHFCHKFFIQSRSARVTVILQCCLLGAYFSERKSFWAQVFPIRGHVDDIEWISLIMMFRALATLILSH